MTTNNYKHIAIEEDIYYKIKELAIINKLNIKDYIKKVFDKIELKKKVDKKNG